MPPESWNGYCFTTTCGFGILTMASSSSARFAASFFESFWCSMSTIVHDVGVETVIPVGVGVGAIIGGSCSHAVFVHVVLGGRVASYRACR